MIWFCPNRTCFRSRPRQGILNLPEFPAVLPVMKGTNMSEDKINFLRENGIDVGLSDSGISSHPLIFDLKINIDIFPERVDHLEPNARLRSRNGKNTISRSTLSHEESHQKNTGRSKRDNVCSWTMERYKRELLGKTIQSADTRKPADIECILCPNLCIPLLFMSRLLQKHTRRDRYPMQFSIPF